MSKTFTMIYLALTAFIAAIAYVFIPFSVTALIMAAAFVMNIFLFIGVLKNK